MNRRRCALARKTTSGVVILIIGVINVLNYLTQVLDIGAGFDPVIMVCLAHVK